MNIPKIIVEELPREGRVFVNAHGMQVDVHVTEDGISVQITKGNEVLAEAQADA